MAIRCCRGRWRTGATVSERLNGGLSRQSLDRAELQPADAGRYRDDRSGDRGAARELSRGGAGDADDRGDAFSRQARGLRDAPSDRRCDGDLHGGDYGEILDIGHVAQERTLEFAVGIRIRDLGWAFGGPPSGTSPGAYQILEAVRTALMGFQPNTGCTPMKAVRERFVDRDRQGGVWVYEIIFSTRTVVVENYRPPSYPLFIKGTQ